MKTIQKSLDRIGISSRFIGPEKSSLSGQVIKDYSVSVALDTLQEAASNLKQEDFKTKEDYERVFFSVLSTPINTP